MIYYFFPDRMKIEKVEKLVAETIYWYEHRTKKKKQKMILKKNN